MELPDNVLSCLKTLLEGVSRAVIKQKPEDIAGFLASYFQEFIDFQKENPDLVLTEVIEKFDLKRETWNGELEEKTSNCDEALLLTESQRKESCTDREEDHHLEDLTSRSSRVTLCPSPTSSIPESTNPTGPDGALSPEGSELERVPSDPAQLPAHVEDSSGSVCLVRDVATTVQTLQEDVSAASAAEASKSQLGMQPWSSISGDLGPSDTQILVLSTDTNQVSSVLLQEGLSSLPQPPPPKEELHAVPACSAAEAISTTDKMIMDAEVPSYTQQFPDKIIISFSGQALSSVKLSLNAGQVSWLVANDAAYQPEQMEGIAPMESAEQACCFRVECSILDDMLKN
ncbi:calcium-binding tyrosine phosphorylation-regulated protein [Meleagris gallopavo]|uniref:calcium-binding tyrosine phosphorylation-regulated protein n=1 Tax=Meleagris gallopavo TaxID=9103 RepID=UPI0005499686|nr:calcium-binding tyrosine phosphorylation-regulated protein [Meleagris gallopavo]